MVQIVHKALRVKAGQGVLVSGGNSQDSELAVRWIEIKMEIKWQHLKVPCKLHGMLIRFLSSLKERKQEQYTRNFNMLH